MRPWLMTVCALLATACGGNELKGEGATLRECKDGEDNDANGLTDCDDPGCEGSSACKDTSDTGQVDLTTVLINEFMASNAAALVLDDGSSPDWIELFNPSEDTIDLQGYFITDDLGDPSKFELGPITIAPMGFALLYADGSPDQGVEHLSFKLSKKGEELGLFDPDGDALTQLEYGEQATDQSAARIPDGTSNWQITTHPTPNEGNRE